VKRLLFLSLPVLAMFGCASTGDLNNLKLDLNAKIALFEGKSADLGQRMEALGGANLALQREVEMNAETVNNLRRGQAETGAAITELRDQLQQIRGSLEGLRRDAAASGVRAAKRDEEAKEFRERLEAATFKIRYLENFLGLLKKEEPPEQPERGKVPLPWVKCAPIKGTGMDKESAYAAAYEHFKEGRYERARVEFQNFLKNFPENEYSDNVQFWIAESLYFENRFERSIPEYEKVIKNYPESNKVSQALLKQALALTNIGELNRARAVLQQVIKNYPNTSQARIARLKLMELR